MMFAGSSRCAALVLLLCCSRTHAQPAAEPMSTRSAEQQGATPAPIKPALDPKGGPHAETAGRSALSADARTGARQAYARGEALFAEGKYAAAKQAFERAYELVPNPVVLLSTAECNARLGSVEEAHLQLQRYLSERPDAPDRAAVERRATELAAKPAVLLLSSQPTGAAIHVDGRESGAQTPAALLVTPGEHEITFSLRGYDSAQERVHAPMGGRYSVRRTLHAAASGAAPTPSSRFAGKQAAADSASPAIWITGIVGGVGVATGTVLGIMALNERDHFNNMPTETSADHGERLALFADVAFAVGAVSLITTAVLCLTADEETVEPAPSGVELSAVASLSGAGLTASGRF